MFVFVDRAIESYQRRGFMTHVAHENETYRKFSVCLDKSISNIVLHSEIILAYVLYLICIM
jgi:hypothetical protein